MRIVDVITSAYGWVKGRNGEAYVQVRNAYDTANDMLKVQSMQKKFRESFAGASVDSSVWDQTVGSGASNTVSGGVLTMNSGAIANADTYLLSKDTFTVPFKLSFALGLSQRIANQTFYVEAVSVDPTTLVPDNKSTCGFVFDGTTATTSKYKVQNNGSSAVETSNTFPTTAGTVSFFEVEPFGDECWFHGGTLDSNAGRANSYRKHKDIPNPNALYKIRLRWLNGSTAPASTTAATLAYVACQDYAELTAEITAGRGQAVAGQGVGVNVIGSVPVTGSAAHDSASSENPINIGARAYSATPAVVSATGDKVQLVATMGGILVTRPFSIPEGEWQYGAPSAITNTTDVVLKAAGAAGIRNYVTGVHVKNTSATATEFVIKDGSTVIFRGHLGASMPQGEFIQFATPLKGTAATAMNFACITTGASVYVNAQGYQAP